MRRVLGTVGAVLEVVAVWIIVTHFDGTNAWFFCGLTLSLAGMFSINAAFNITLRRSLDEEFEAGYRVGYRAGRRAPIVAQTVADLETFRQRRREDGRVSQAPIRALAGDRPHARRPTTHAH